MLGENILNTGKIVLPQNVAHCSTVILSLKWEALSIVHLPVVSLKQSEHFHPEIVRGALDDSLLIRAIDA